MVGIEISRLKTVPFTDEELLQKSEAEALGIRLDRLEKVIAEEVIATNNFQDLNKLRNMTLELCDHYTEPVIVKSGNTWKGSFILDKCYDQRDSNGIFEIILYSFEKEPKVENEMKLDATTASNLEQGIDLLTNHHTGGRALNDKERALADILKLQNSGNPNFQLYSKMADMLAVTTSINDLAGNGASDFPVTLTRRKRENLEKFPLRAPGIAGKPVYMPDRAVKILCRIVGKGWNNVYAHKEYYLQLHHIKDGIQYIDNTIHAPLGSVEFRKVS